VASLADEAHPYLRGLAPEVDLAPLAEKASAVKGLPVVVANAPAIQLQKIKPLPNVALDLGRIESAADMNALAKRFSANRLVFGSAAPLRPLTTAITALRKSSLTRDDKRAVRFENAVRARRASDKR
jgi:predicted TIM-barrel fold metal-dependent hydrolase